MFAVSIHCKKPCVRIYNGLISNLLLKLIIVILPSRFVDNNPTIERSLNYRLNSRDCWQSGNVARSKYKYKKHCIPANSKAHVCYILLYHTLLIFILKYILVSFFVLHFEHNFCKLSKATARAKCKNKWLACQL